MSETTHVVFNPQLPHSPLGSLLADWERGGWRLVRIVPHHEYESVAVFERPQETPDE